MKKIVTLGPKGTYSNHVANTIVPDDMGIDLVTIPPDLIEAVKKISGDIVAGSLGNMAVIQKIPESMAGIVPIHNTHGKMVNLAPIGIYQLRLKYPTTRIIGWYSLQIDHILASNHHTNLGNLKHIYSHPQAISQCSENITKLQRKITLHNTPSTTSHIPYLRDGEAVICSEQSARDNDLHILDDAFGPQNNITSFAVVSTNEELEMRDFNGLNKDKT
ncbi:MAG: prephenate dehydratase domain-containing protein, partial [Candidatus Gracilibacteria bacterium]|nr:prephenate dehydratase domain-containing protein [Candidatus Gracilibacteria bacterium]